MTPLQIYRKAWYEKNKEAVKARAAAARLADVEAYRAKGRERSKADPLAPARKRAYKERHPARVNEQAAEYRAKHGEAITQRIEAWRERNPDKLCDYAARRRVAKGRAVTAWADRDLVQSFYKLARIYRAAGVLVEVDHCVPIQHELVCGLHCDANLEVVARRVNRAKSNRYWPDMP